MYTIPKWAARISYRGSTLTYDGSIPVSYGTDLIEVSLDSGLEGNALTIAFCSQGAHFGVQAWQLHEDDVGPRRVARAQTGVHGRTPHPQALSGDCSQSCTYTIPHLDAPQIDRLALIVVRLDPDETTDPVGSYQVVVDSAQ
jgi:hypothetical protein